MPIYAFICAQCGSRREVFYSASVNHLTVCNKCDSIMKKDYKEMIPAYHDVAFDSVDYDLTGKPIPYSTKGQLREIAKRHGCRVE